MIACTKIVSIRVRGWMGLLTLLAISAVGCSGSSTPAARLEKAYREANLQPSPVVKFAGTVTVDGQPPSPFTLVLLMDPKNPKAGVQKTVCDADGKFAFTSYEAGDGVPPGSYVVLFARFNMGGRLGQYDPPDLMHNLYNDPEKNVEIPEFQVTVAAPGKTDYAFELSVSGKEPVTHPGPDAVTELTN